MPGTLDAKGYYELLFWGGGHVLQFTWTLLLLVAWLLLADAIGARVPHLPARGRAAVRHRPRRGIRDAADIPRLRRDLRRASSAADVADALRRRTRDRAGRRRGDLVARSGAAGASRAATRGRGRSTRRSSTSIVLFGVGGLIGFAIHGSNVRIPAHYHGCIVGVTIAMMGVTYWLLPRLGFAAPLPRLATWQAYLYGGGQLMHIAGLVWSGGYGVQRKVADGAEVERSLEQVAGMGLMGLGGFVAIVGGMLFVAVVIIAVVRRPRATAPVSRRMTRTR